MSLEQVEYFESEYEGFTEERLDKVLLELLQGSSVLGGMTRSQLKRRIELGQVSVDGAVVLKAGAAVQPGAKVRCAFAPERLHASRPYAFDLEVVYEDESLLVINKPAGLTVHPGAGTTNETLVGALIYRYGPTPESVLSRMGIVHRLDKDTTGLMVIARNSIALSHLSRQFQERTIDRSYWALVESTPRGKREIDLHSTGSVETLIGRHPTNRLLMSVVREGGKRAVTHWQVKERFAHGVLLEVKLQTGRTHQIRVHMQHLGSPVVGDREYCLQSVLPLDLKRSAESFGRQALHAFRLGFEHPCSGENLTFETDFPASFAELIGKFRSAQGI